MLQEVRQAQEADWCQTRGKSHGLKVKKYESIPEFKTWLEQVERATATPECMRGLSADDFYQFNGALAITYTWGHNARTQGWYSAHLTGPMGINVRRANTGVWSKEGIAKRFTGARMEKFQEIAA
jgi:hypothetical protein